MKGLAAVVLASASLAAFAGDPPRWYLHHDNDVVFATDRWYTSGVRLARVQDRGDYALEWGLLQEIYTPEAKKFVPGTVDRAPAARLLVSLVRHDNWVQCFQTFELAIGVRGPAAQGRRATDLVHRLVAAPDVDWTREEANRLAVQLGAVRSVRVGSAVVHYGAVVGSERSFGHAAAELRIGADMAPQLLRFAATPPPAAGPSGWGAFVGVGARAVVRDEPLSRGYDAQLPAPDRERWVGRLATGVGTVQRWGSVLFALAIDTREFDGQRVPHRFGSLVIHLDF